MERQRGLEKGFFLTFHGGFLSLSLPPESRNSKEHSVLKPTSTNSVQLYNVTSKALENF